MMKITPKFCVDYPIIGFKCNDGVSKLLRGRGVGKFLVVAQVPYLPNTYKVYRKNGGKPVYEVSFTDPDLAASFADWIDTEFADYMDIWDSIPDADIIAVCKWAVEDGVQKFIMINSLFGKTIKTREEIETLYINAKEKVEDWTRGLNVYTG